MRRFLRSPLAATVVLVAAVSLGVLGLRGLAILESLELAAYDWYLRLGPLANANAKYIHGTLPTWNDFVEHPNYDAFWKAQAMAYLLKKPTVPNLNVAGWWDQEDFYGPMKIYETLEKKESFLPRIKKSCDKEPF